MSRPTAVVFSGAGLSADSGVPTFRGMNGLWENHRVEDVANHDAWWRDRDLVLRFYAERYNRYRGCRPHAGHFALARLQEKYRVVHITQNIDDLLEQAGCEDVVHLHGMLTRKKCERHRDIPAEQAPSPGASLRRPWQAPNSGRTFECDYKCTIDSPVELGDACPKCGGQMRPDVVWFGEAVDMHYELLESLEQDVQSDGLFLCVGTSGQVYPAASLVAFFASATRKFIVDPDARPHRDYELLVGRAVDELPRLVDRLLSPAP